MIHRRLRTPTLPRPARKLPRAAIPNTANRRANKSATPFRRTDVARFANLLPQPSSALGDDYPENPSLFDRYAIPVAVAAIGAWFVLVNAGRLWGAVQLLF